jgi:hypothetical protein
MKKTCKQQIEDDAAELVKALTQITPPDGPKGEWLKLLYKSFTERFLSDNSRIWTTGAVMIPFSLAPLAVLLTLREPDQIHFLVLATASLTIYVSWLVIADGHRRFQNKSYAWLLAIQQVIGLNDTGPSKLGEYMLTKWVTVRRMRYIILLILVMGWWIAYCSWSITPKEAADNEILLKCYRK